jgi:hypothetical protein
MIAWGFLMKLLDFYSHGGFLKLALARLSQCEYSLILYLLSRLPSDVDELVSASKEISQSIGYSERTVKTALEGLAHFQIISMRLFRESVVVKVQFDPSLWVNLRASPARKIVLGDASNLRSLSPLPEIEIGDFGHKTVLKDDRAMPIGTSEAEPEIKSFRIKSQKENLELRQAAENEIDADKKGIRAHTEDELFLLQVILKHAEPRKQLHWALEASFRYPGLAFFFKTCRHLAIAPRKVKR